MRWHLLNPMGVSERTTEAEDAFWAGRRLAPIPKGWFVASDASYRMGWVGADMPAVCSKCFKKPPALGNKKCETCRKRDRATASKANAKKPTRDAKWRAKLSPEEKEAIAERERQRKRAEYRVKKEGPIRPYVARPTKQLTLSL